MKNNGRAPRDRSQIVCVRRAIQLRAPLLTGASACKGRSTSDVLRRGSAFVSTGARRMNDGKDQLRCFARRFIPQAASASQGTGRSCSRLGERSSHAIPAARRCKLRPSSVCEARTNRRYGHGEVRSRGCGHEMPDSSNGFYQAGRSGKQTSDMGRSAFRSCKNRTYLLVRNSAAHTAVTRSKTWCAASCLAL